MLLLVCMLTSLGFSASGVFKGKVEWVRVIGDWDQFPAGEIIVQISGQGNIYKIEKGDPNKKEMLSLLLTAKTNAQDVTIRVNDTAYYGAITSVQY